MKYCVYTRSFFENPYLSNFIQHYLNLGFDKIVVLHSGGAKYDTPEKFSDRVEIHYVSNYGDNILSYYDYLIKNSDFDWVLSVDIDEFLLLNEKYKNIDEYVQEKLLFNNKINVFYFRWGMIEKYDIENNNNFLHILQNYKIFSNMHIKTMFKKQDLMSVCHPHLADLHNLTIFFENNILTNNQPIISLSEESYKEHVLIHIHTRSLHNLVLKSFNTVFHGKIIKSKNEFIEFINTLEDKVCDDNVIALFIKYIGSKAELPYLHKNDNLVNMAEFNILKYDYDIIDSNDNIDISNCLNDNNVNLKKYFDFINCLNEKVVNDKTFIHAHIHNIEV